MSRRTRSLALEAEVRARIQTFPDDFEFLGGKESVRKQIGMAVPVDGAAVVFTALFRSLAGIPYPSVEPNLQNLLPVRQVRKVATPA